MNISLFHPIVNHFTIALISISVILDILGVLTKKQYFHTAAWINLVIGTISGVLTIITGLIAEDTVHHSEAAHQIMETHETLGFVILALVLIILIWRLILKGQFPVKGKIFYIFIGISIFALILLNGYYGGELVFKHGVAVQNSILEVVEKPGNRYNQDSNTREGIIKGSTRDTVSTTQIDESTFDAGRKQEQDHDN